MHFWVYSSLLWLYILRYCPFSTGVIPKSVRPQHIKDNLSVNDFQLSAKDMAILNHMNTNTRFCWDPTAVTWHCRQGKCWQISLIKQEKKSAHRQCPLLLMLVPRCSPEVTWRKLSLSSRKEERYWNYKNVQFVLSIIKQVHYSNLSKFRVFRVKPEKVWKK